MAGAQGAVSVETIIQSRRTNKFLDRIIVIAASAHAPAAAKFSPNNETTDNRRSIEPQTRCQNRL
jgi:hypothetical protein